VNKEEIGIGGKGVVTNPQPVLKIPLKIEDRLHFDIGKAYVGKNFLVNWDRVCAGFTYQLF
jgi:hypothetical protein